MYNFQNKSSLFPFLFFVQAYTFSVQFDATNSHFCFYGILLFVFQILLHFLFK